MDAAVFALWIAQEPMPTNYGPYGLLVGALTAIMGLMAVFYARVIKPDAETNRQMAEANRRCLELANEIIQRGENAATVLAHLLERPDLIKEFKREKDPAPTRGG